MKKILLIIIIGIIAVVKIASSFFIAPYYRITSNNILAEVVLWPHISRAYYFVIKSDGTVVGYHGLSRDPAVNRPPDFQPDRSNFFMLVRRRDRVTLSEEEFLHISQLVNRIVEINTHPEVWQGQEAHFRTSTISMFSHDGVVYERGYGQSRPLFDLIGILFELTSLSDFRW